jgi:structural maintenance of chromosome 3 (chondroitin sulfate proteoglycan 6)
MQWVLNLTRALMQRSGGNRLFHVVVETADIAQRCIALLTKNKSGRLTFLPLDELRPHTLDLRKVEDFHQRQGLTGTKNHVLVPIVNFLNFDPSIQKAVDSVWGKVLVAKDLSVANAGAKFCDAECCTRDGVRVRCSTNLYACSACVILRNKV